MGRDPGGPGRASARSLDGLSRATASRSRSRFVSRNRAHGIAGGERSTRWIPRSAWTVSAARYLGDRGWRCRRDLFNVRTTTLVMAEILEGEVTSSPRNGGFVPRSRGTRVARAPDFETAAPAPGGRPTANEGPVSDMPIAGADQACAEPHNENRLWPSIRRMETYAQLSNDRFQPGVSGSDGF